MRAFNKGFAFLVIALGISIQCFAVQNLKISCDNPNLFDNYYVQPGGIYISPHTIFVMIEGHLVQINILCSDQKGVFVPYEEMNRQFVRCPNCGNGYDPDHPENHKCKGY